MSVTDLASRLTRRSRSNFYYAFLTLPRPRREALYALYAFCRTVDDIADLGQERGVDPATPARGLARGDRALLRPGRPARAPDRPAAGRRGAGLSDPPGGPAGHRG